MLRLLIACLVFAVATAPAWSAETPTTPPPENGATLDEATRIAAEIIQSRAKDPEIAGQAALAGQLNALAQGLLAGRVTLYDASLVMQIALASAHPKASASSSTQAQPAIDPKTSARQATALLDGVAVEVKPAGNPVAGGPSNTAGTTPAAPAAPAVDAPKPAKTITTKVYAIDIGSDGRVSKAIIGAGSKNGVIVGNRFAIRRNNLPVGVCAVVQVKDGLSYCQLVPGSLVDPRDDVKEGDQAILSNEREAKPDAKSDIKADAKGDAKNP
ncbi:MAG: hypothetical protein H0W83_12615 [Planctomycetes bacterium]|nr:hypothetical protein [Planctomycetota bacterium]